mmetsp:Transcript_48704/g.99454  ORF Transcript_48704/g.99454 Transcript_48704/m.99454 type:complete len:242 (-) Transcript_48704:146-871(-)
MFSSDHLVSNPASRKCDDTVPFTCDSLVLTPQFTPQKSNSSGVCWQSNLCPNSVSRASSSAASTGSVDSEDLSLLSGHSTPTHDSFTEKRRKPHTSDSWITCNKGKQSTPHSDVAKVLWPIVHKADTCSRTQRYLQQIAAIQNQQNEHRDNSKRLSPRAAREAREQCTTAVSKPSNGRRTSFSGSKSPKTRHINTSILRTWLNASPSLEPTVFIKLSHHDGSVHVQSCCQVDVVEEHMIVG